MKRKELEKLPVLRATTAMLKQTENEPMIELSLIHISEPTRQAEISYAVFCLKKKEKKTIDKICGQ